MSHSTTPAGGEMQVKRKYCPRNGSEGEAFIEKWCDRCKHDEHGCCAILAASLLFGETDAEYPAEWTYDADGEPCCTAFEKREDVPDLPCRLTQDMFGK